MKNKRVKKGGGYLFQLSPEQKKSLLKTPPDARDEQLKRQTLMIQTLSVLRPRR